MKQLIFSLTIFVNFKVQAQIKFEHNFLGDEFSLYKGVLFKIIDNPISGFDFSFYSDIKYCQSKYDNHIIYPDINNIATVKDSLMNRIFLVESIVNKTGLELSEYLKTEYDYIEPIFILRDTVSGQIIYYKYDKKHEHNFPFNTSKIIYPEDYFCSKIEKQKDEFTDEIKFSSPYSNDTHALPMIIYKIIKKGNAAVYYLSLNTTGSTFNMNKSGVIILFEDGTKWTRASKIDADVGSDGFDYSAFIALTQIDLATFSKKKIKKFRLYIYDQDVDSFDADSFKMYTECIKKAK